MIVNPEKLCKDFRFAPIDRCYVPAVHIKELAFGVFGEIKHLRPCIFVYGLLQKKASADQFGNIKFNILFIPARKQAEKFPHLLTEHVAVAAEYHIDQVFVLMEQAFFLFGC